MTPRAGDGPFDRAGDRDVDDQQRSAVPAGRFHVGDGDHVAASGGAGQDDVTRSQRVGQPVEADGGAAEPLGELGAPFGRPVADDDLAGATAMKRGGDADAHLAGADDEHPAAGERTEPIADHLHRGVADRGRPSADRGFRPGAAIRGCHAGLIVIVNPP